MPWIFNDLDGTLPIKGGHREPHRNHTFREGHLNVLSQHSSKTRITYEQSAALKSYIAPWARDRQSGGAEIWFEAWYYSGVSTSSRLCEVRSFRPSCDRTRSVLDIAPTSVDCGGRGAQGFARK